MDDWKQKHINFYRQQPSLPDSSAVIQEWKLPTILQTILSSCDSEEDKVELLANIYKSCNQVLKSISNDELTPFCTEIKIILNYEHRNEYSAYKAEMMNELGIPAMDAWIDETVKKLDIKETDVVKTRLSLNRQPIDMKYFDMIFSTC